MALPFSGKNGECNEAVELDGNLISYWAPVALGPGKRATILYASNQGPRRMRKRTKGIMVQSLPHFNLAFLLVHGDCFEETFPHRCFIYLPGLQVNYSACLSHGYLANWQWEHVHFRDHSTKPNRGSEKLVSTIFG